MSYFDHVYAELLAMQAPEDPDAADRLHEQELDRADLGVEEVGPPRPSGVEVSAGGAS